MDARFFHRNIKCFANYRTTLNYNVSTHKTRSWNSPSNESIHVGNLNLLQIHCNCKGKWNFYILKFYKSFPPNLKMTHKMSSTLEFNKIVQKSNRHKRRSLEIREVFFLYIQKAMKVSKFGAKIWISKHFFALCVPK